ncbi:MAG: PHP domain-containing protein [Gammaproteobacteria bacterium]|nr:PHP domain-containing protein [Gammaproteobacteria bacterium]
MHYDLHTHSTASDGTLSPADLVKRAKQQGVDVLALTDHDTTEGLKEAALTAEQEGIILVKGVEISVTWEKMTVHILGLGIDPDDQVLQKGLNGLRTFRQWRAEEIGRRLEKSGIENAYDGALKYVKGQLVSRTHFARYLVECGKAKNVGDVFKKYLVNNKPGYVSGQWGDLEDVVSWIRGAGGTAVIAHPARYRMSATKLRRLIEHFKAFGGTGIEVVSGSHSPNDRNNMALYAKRYSLLASQGSDYHGPENPWIELGKLHPLPSGCEPVWSAWS